MNQPNAAQQSSLGTYASQLPPPPSQSHSAGLAHQRRPFPEQHPRNPHPAPQGPYSPHTSTHNQPQHGHSPYVGSVPGVVQHHPGETTFYGAHPSPYSTHSASGSYASSEHNDSMATQAAISRQPFPPISSYQTPQSNSPASIHSPQTDAHGRLLYAMPPMAQQMYYSQYQMQQPPTYAPHPSASHHPSMTSAPGMLVSHQQPQPQPQSQPLMPQPQHQPSHPHQPTMIDTKPPPPTSQRPPSVAGAPHGTPQTPSAPAPGPIPATTPLVVRQDNNGVQWIAFEYSRDRVKMEYTIRCDVESVNVDELSAEFKNSNCVYPRACCGKDQYKGNRLHYESECNSVGWALAQLNPNLRDKRGLIQRAVDSWRNSNQDPRLRSRRVRRQAKIHNRKAAHGMQSSTAGPMSGPQGPPSAGLQQPPHGLPGGRPTIAGPGGSHMHHHHDGSEASDEMSAGPDYHTAPAHHHQHQQQQHGHPQQQHHPHHQPHGRPPMTSPASAAPRYTQNFYPSYPQHHGPTAAAMPSVHDAMDPIHSHASALATSTTGSVKEEDEDTKRALFGDVPESKRRKFILVDDAQRGTRVRVRVLLDQVKMDDMPDAHLRINAVFPRSYYPRQMRSPPGSPRARGDWDDENDDVEGASGTLPTIGKTVVPVSLMDGSETSMSVPRMTKSRRSKEVALNELGYRMAWGQARTFNSRTLFLQRSLDAYRNKIRSTMVGAGQEVSTISPHFETRPGKRKWLERGKRSRHAESP